MDRYCLKDIHPLFFHPDGMIQIGDEPGFSSEIEDEGNFLRTFLPLLDGSRSLQEIAQHMRFQFPDVTEELLGDVVKQLDENGHIELLPGYDKHDSTNRYLSNLNFLLNFSSIQLPPRQLQERIHRTSVGIIGLGGLGSNLLLQLVGLGYQRFVVVEPDDFEAKNLNRQFLYRTKDIGRPKAEAAVENIREFHPGIEIVAHRKNIASSYDLHQLLPDGLDLLVCAADFPMIMIQTWCNQFAIERGIPLFGGGTGSLQGHFFTVVPNESACLECYYRSLMVRKETRNSLLSVINYKNRNTAIGPTITMIASVIGFEILKYTLGLPLISQGRRVNIHFDRLDVQTESLWEKDPNCLCQTRGIKSPLSFFKEMEA